MLQRFFCGFCLTYITKSLALSDILSGFVESRSYKIQADVNMEKGSTILEGEASESDEELADYPSFMQNTMVSDVSPNVSVEQQKSAKDRISGVVISGEASESDEEPFEYLQPSGGRDFPSLVANYPETAHLSAAIQDTSTVQKSTTYRDGYKRPKFKSPFHKRFRENNFHLRCGVVENTLDTYSYSSEKLKFCKPFVAKTLESVQATLLDLKVAIEAFSVLQLSVDNLVETTVLPSFKKLEKSK